MYFDQANNYWVAAVSLGHKGGKRVRRKVFGRTKTEVKAKFRELRRDMENGVRPSARYTVDLALDDWLANGLSGRSDRTKELYQDTVKPLAGRLGDVKLGDLTAGDVQETFGCAGRAAVHAQPSDHPSLSRAGYPACRSPRSGWPERGGLVKAPAGGSVGHACAINVLGAEWGINKRGRPTDPTGR